MTTVVSAGSIRTDGRGPTGVLISHPVHQHAYETAVAAQEAGLLRWFVTGIYRTNRGLIGASTLRKLPSPLRSHLETELLRRWHPELDPGRVHTITRYHVLATALRRLHEHNCLPGSFDLDIWAHRQFDIAVGNFLRGLQGVRIVHAFEGSGLATFRTAKRLSMKTVLDATSTYESYVRALGKTASQKDLDRARAERELADLILVPSAYSIDCLVENGVSREKILKIPYGVDHVRFAPRPESRRRDVFRVLYVGSIGLRKGVRYLLEAWRALALTNAELVLVGQPEDAGREILREFEGSYRWPGQIPKYAVDEWFHQSDVFVLPSLADSWGLAVTEAMACGVPVVTTSRTGAPVRDRVDGLVVPPADARALHDAIRFLYEHPEERRRMGERGRAHVSAAYTWGHYRSRIANAYNWILSVDPAYESEPVAMEALLP